MASSVTGIGSALAALNSANDVGAAGIARAVDRTSAATAGRARANASGRPGPNAPTGDFRRSITHEAARTSGTVTSGVVGTNAAQARRLELGFVGTDSDGRTYNQPPYPYLFQTEAFAAEMLADEVSAAIDARFTQP